MGGRPRQQQNEYSLRCTIKHHADGRDVLQTVLVRTARSPPPHARRRLVIATGMPAIVENPQPLPAVGHMYALEAAETLQPRSLAETSAVEGGEGKELEAALGASPPHSRTEDKRTPLSPVHDNILTCVETVPALSMPEPLKGETTTSGESTPTPSAPTPPPSYLAADESLDPVTLKVEVEDDAESAIQALLALQQEPSPPMQRSPGSPSPLGIHRGGIHKSEATIRFYCRYPRCGKGYASTDAVRKHCRQRHLEWLRRLGHGCPALYCRWEE